MRAIKRWKKISWVYGFDQGSYLDVMYVDSTGKFLSEQKK